MNNKLYELVDKAKQGDKECILLIIEKFRPLVNKYSRYLNYDGADSDLIINLIEIVKNIPIFKNEDMKKEECIVGYISNSLRYKYIKLSKKHSHIYNIETELTEGTMYGELNNSVESNVENRIVINNALDKLSKKQKYIIQKIFEYGYKDSEIARELNISRQAVYKTKKKVLEKLKKELVA